VDAELEAAHAALEEWRQAVGVIFATSDFDRDAVEQLIKEVDHPYACFVRRSGEAGVVQLNPGELAVAQVFRASLRFEEHRAPIAWCTAQHEP
jgi:hypothetical protein